MSQFLTGRRAACPVCGMWCTLRSSGRVAVHGPIDVRCNGSRLIADLKLYAEWQRRCNARAATYGAVRRYARSSAIARAAARLDEAMRRWVARDGMVES